MRFKKGMILKEDIYSVLGVLLLKRGTRLTDSHIQFLNHHQLKVKGFPQNNNLYEDVYKNVFSAVQDLQSNIAGKTKLNDKEVQEMISEFDTLYQEFIVNDIQISEIMKKFSQDEYLFKHSINVGLIASKIGRVMGLSDEYQHLLARMGLFHDVGKFKINADILNKPSKLTNEEFNKIKQHPKLGYDLLLSTSLEPLILEGVLKHHERLNGSGYPNGISEGDIPFFVRILSVADTFDAICSNRVYQGEKSVFYAVEEMIKDANSNGLDRKIVLKFTYSLMELSKGMKFNLRNGKQGEILRVDGNHPNQPIIKIEGYQPLDLQKENLTLYQVANI